jgi:hypothetical protein
LYKPITVEAKEEPLEEVLQKISHKGNFYFSYNSNLIKKDSLVTVSAQNRPVKEILDRVLEGRFEYKESPNYIILRPAFYKLSVMPEAIQSRDKFYFISGYVRDEKTGTVVKDVSVYEKRLLQSTLTDQQGYFRLKFNGEHSSVILTASKENYKDTTMLFLSDVKIRPEGYTDTTDNSGYTASDIVERLGLGRFFISSRQKIQSLNISGLLANSPFQASLTPGLSSHGMLSSQVVNKASLNVVGGYTAGVDGAELAGVFNINKGNVQHVQVAGMWNLVGGSVKGLQVAGLMNTVLDGVSGVQVGGIVNKVSNRIEGAQIGGVLNLTGKEVKGFEIAGVTNFVSGNFEGVQVAGVLNYLNKKSNGISISGISNIAKQGINGVQITGVFNYAKKLKGLQIGLINLADTSSGYSIGLLNWVNKGYHKVSLSVNEVMNTNLSFKTGNSKLYTLYLGGANFSNNAKAYSAGLGFGHDFIFNKTFSIAFEAASQYLYLGNFNDVNLLNRAQSNFQFKLFKPFTIFAGPAYSLYYSNSGGNRIEGYRSSITPKKYKSYSNVTTGWWGWNVGITIM